MDNLVQIPEIDDLIKKTDGEDVAFIVSNILATDFSQYTNLSVDAHGLSDSDDNINIIHTETNITPQIIECLEEDLEFYEKVSLVFLLYDSDDLALQRLKIAHRSNQSGSISQCGLLSDWAARASSLHWEDKILESLCIIQNYQVIAKLGYCKKDVKLRFLPENPETSLFVDLMRKALYHMCESLSVVKLDHLLKLVQKDMGLQGRLQEGYSTEYMEMNVLHWMSQRYLNVGAQGSFSNISVKNLSKHLKVMGELNLADYLDSMARLSSRQGVPQHGTRMETESVSAYSEQMSIGSTSSTNTFYRGPRSSHSVTSHCEEENMVLSGSNQKCYTVDLNHVGYCVIINQKNFYREPDPNYQHLLLTEHLETRVGTDVDRDRLSEMFLNFGFTVKIWENLTHLDIMQAIREASTNLVRKEHSCFVLCILSHGKKNAVYGTNSISVDVDEIEKSIHGKYCPKLMHKPKILIIQACQGLQKQDALPSDVDSDGATYTKTCPEVSDMVTFWSTVPGYAAFRDRITGSWFIKTLWNQLLLKESVDVDLMSIFIEVIGQVCDKRAPINGELKAMTPQLTTSFRKKLFFPYHQEARKATAKRMLERYLFEHLVEEYFVRLCHLGSKTHRTAFRRNKK